MKLTDTLPALRHIEVLPLDGEEGSPQATFLLRDPQQLCDRSLSVTGPVLFCLQCFDGATQVATLAELWREASEGQELPLEQLEGMVRELDEVYLLHNDRAKARLQEVRQEFAAATVRSTHYGGESAAVAEILDGLYRQAETPNPAEIAAEDNDLGLLLAPHIDYARGQTAWPLAYRHLKRHFNGDVILLLGTNHQFHETPLALTRKVYRTPLGDVRTDVELVDRLAAALPFDAFADEFCHRDEHSIELAATALKHLYGDQCPAIVPVLCGSLDEFVAAGVDPETHPLVQQVREALRQLVAHVGPRLTVLASVDLAHIGPQFGDIDPVDDPTLEHSLARDSELMRAIATGNPQTFSSAILAERNTRHVCGVAAIYFGLSCQPVEGAIDSSLHYWKSEDGYGAVSFTAMALKRKA